MMPSPPLVACDNRIRKNLNKLETNDANLMTETMMTIDLIDSMSTALIPNRFILYDSIYVMHLQIIKCNILR